MIAEIEAAIAGDQEPLARLIEIRLVQPDCPRGWCVRVRIEQCGARRLARIYLGLGTDAFVYVTTEGRVRYSGAVPVRWRRELGRILLGELGILDIEKRPGGMVGDRQPHRTRGAR